MKNIYLDYAATTPVDPAVMAAMQPYFTDVFGNASSPHGFGQRARQAMENARDTIASFIGAQSAEIVFTSSATEASNFAIFGMAEALKDRGKHIVVSAIEHHAVLEPIEQLAKRGYEVTVVPVSTDEGLIDPQTVRDIVRDDTVLIAAMHASNEIGAIQPIAEIGTMAREKNIPFLVDAVQTVGHIPVNVNELKCDLLTLSAHKCYGPKGIGSLYIRSGVKPCKYLWGGDQERERRASTQNVPGIVGLGKAIELCQEKMSDDALIQTNLRDQLIDKILTIGDVKLNGHRRNRLPNNVNVSLAGIKGEDLITALDMDGFAVSMGSACTSGALEPSHVLRAIGRSQEEAFGSLRITLGRSTTENDIARFLKSFQQKITALRGI